MSNRLSRSTTANVPLVALLIALLAFSPPAAWAGAAEPAGGAAAGPASPEPSTPGISQAEQFYREGVSLYSREMFREALNAFNRALALEPDHENAKKMLQKCEGKIQIISAGETPSTAQTFDVFDPQSIPSPAEGGVPESAEDIKYNRTKELITQGQFYLENKKFERAQEFFEQVLLIDPGNQTATRLLAEATLGAYENQKVREQRNLDIDREKIRTGIELRKQLPEGSDDIGIKDPGIYVPVEEEEYEEVEEESVVQRALRSPVTIEFDNAHINDIVEFIGDYVGINIVVDARVVAPPPAPAPPTAPTGVPTGAPFPGGAIPPGGVPIGGVPGAVPPPGGGLTEGGNLAGLRAVALAGQPGAGGAAGAGLADEQVTTGIVPYIKLTDVPLASALKALLRPLNLSYSLQPDFLWISTAEKIRTETFEELETRIYELRNAGAETLFKIVVTNQGGSLGGLGGGGFGGGGLGGGLGGGFGGGGLGGFGGGGLGGLGGGGFGGGGLGGLGGGGFGGGGLGGGGFGGGGLGGLGGGGFGGGGLGGLGGGGFGGGGLGGGFGGGGLGGGFGGRGGAQFSNIAQLFTNISDTLVGETPAVIGISEGGTGLQNRQFAGQQAAFGGGGGGAFGGGGLGGGGGGLGGEPGLGGTAGLGGFQGQAEILTILESAIPPVIEPFTGEVLSWMIYNPTINQLIVHSTPSYLNVLEDMISNLDVTPKQVSIESKFITIRVQDLDKIGFTWNVNLSDNNNNPRPISNLLTTTTDAQGNPAYSVDVNGDGVLEAVPFYTKPDGTSVFNNRIVQSMLEAAANPGPEGAFSLETIITDSSDGDRLSVVFDYLDSLEETELLSAPRVTTMNRKPAVIADFLTQTFNTQVISFLLTSDAAFGGAATVAASQQLFFETFIFGITLSVTPQISGGNQVRLWLNPQVTTQVGQDEFVQRTVVNGDELTANIRFPRTSVQSVWTNVIVHDGDTLVLGGLIEDNTVRGQEKLPYLANIPVIGFLFRGKSSEVTQRSLLMFVTVDIIDPTGARFFEAAAS